MIKQFKKELYFILLLLLLNTNKILSISSIILLCLYGRKNVKNAVKALLYSTILSQLNLFIFSSGASSFRTLLNIYLMFRIISHKNVFKYISKQKVFIVMLIYFFYISISALFVSWLPLVSIFKGFYFTVGFLAIYSGIKLNANYDWINFIRRIFTIFINLNFLFMFIPLGYSLNGKSFNGIFHNPNPLGITLSLAIATLMYCDIEKIGRYNKLFIMLAFIEIFMTNSRTSLLTVLIIISIYLVIKLVFLLKQQKKLVFKSLFLLCIGFSFSLVLVSINYEAINETLTDKILKGQIEQNFLYSRENQIEMSLDDFKSNIFTGVGFGVYSGYDKEQSFELKLSYPVERGNIILAILAETGMFGMSIFGLLIITLVIESYNNNLLNIYIKKYIFLITALLISFGEMTFFSGNSIGVFQWFFLAVFVSGNNNYILKEDNLYENCSHSTVL